MLRTPLIVMGVSGSGKSTLGRAIADAVGCRFIEGDACHPPANVAKMSAWLALDDADRRPFLEAVAAAIRAQPMPAVASCSALKRGYRDLLRRTCPDAVFVLPHLTGDQLQVRMRDRTHFMPVSLLESQLATLEMPADDEAAIIVDGTMPVPQLVAEVLRRLAQRSPPVAIGAMR